MHIWTGDYNAAIRNWDYQELLDRIRERRSLKRMELYSHKYMAYCAIVFKAKKGKKGKKKGKKKSK